MHYNSPWTACPGGYCLRIEDFDYDLPEDRIAQTPLEPRDASRLLVLSRTDGRIAHRTFRDLLELLRPGDCLVLNDSRVLPARLVGRRPGGGRAEVLLLRRSATGGGAEVWEALVRPARRLRPGASVLFGEGDGALTATVLERGKGGEAVLRLSPAGGTASAQSADGTAGETSDAAGRVDRLLRRLGRAPLPPYIRAPLADPERYQTVYACEEGSAAAPTAGLHFTPELLAAIQDRGVAVARLTLHVGLDTFRPVQVERLADHRMHAEFYRLPEEAAALVNATRARGGRVVAVGTTAVRVLETCAAGGGVRAGEGWTDLFIFPGYRFQAVDALLTNFHLPRSTLLMLVAAFAGREAVLAAYEEAVREGYRFYSFGDAMLIL